VNAVPFKCEIKVDFPVAFFPGLVLFEVLTSFIESLRQKSNLKFNYVRSETGFSVFYGQHGLDFA